MKSGCRVLRKRQQFEVRYAELQSCSCSVPKSRRWAYEWLDSVVFALLLLLLLFTFGFRMVGVRGPSMLPTLQNGNWLVLKSVVPTVRRGDIVVVTQPNDLNEPLIKRVIAVAGDEVRIDFSAGTVSVNGEVLDEPYINEKTHRASDVVFPVTVPPNCIFVMGDNRNHSLDSRSSTVGFIDARYVLGTAEYRLYPPGEWKIKNDG